MAAALVNRLPPAGRLRLVDRLCLADLLRPADRLCPADLLRPADRLHSTDQLFPADRISDGEIVAESAGIDAFEGESASPQAVEVMRRRGIDLNTHVARRLTLPMLEGADLVVTMTVAQRERVLQLGPEFGEKVFLFSELADAGDMTDVADPWCGSVERYEECAVIMEGFLERMQL